MADKEIDDVSGVETTGHEWDGLKELNNPLPKWWLYVFYATIAFSVVYMIWMPSLPSWAGLGDFSSRKNLVEDLAEQRTERGEWLQQFEEKELEELAADRDLQRFAMAGGRSVYADNCAPCHGSGGAGNPGYPVLADDAWVWGGTLDAIHQTILYGVRNEHEEARFSLMPSYGVDRLLEPAQIEAVTDYVLSLSGGGDANAEGEEIFVNECAACHGEDGKGIAELGAPNLTDAIWLNVDGSRPSIIAQIHRPKHGVMPPWDGRLTDAEIKQVTLYVHSLGGGQ